MTPFSHIKRSVARSLVFSIMAIGFFMFTTSAHAQLTYYSKTSGVWTTASTWSLSSHTGANSTTVPTSLDIVKIGAGHTVTINSNTTANASSVTVNDDAAGGTLTLGNNTNTAFTLTVGGNVTVNSGGVIQTGGNGGATHTFNIGGNLTNDGTFNMRSASGDVVNVVFNGASTKTISGSGSTFTFNNFTMSTTLSSDINLNSSITIYGALNFTNTGLIILNASNNITFTSTGSIGTGGSAPSSTKYIQVDGTTGTNSTVIKTSSTATSTLQFSYPIGTSTGGYSPVSIPTVGGTNPTSGTTVAIKAINATDLTGQLKRTFRITVAGNASTNATTFSNPTFSYNTTADISSGDDISNYTTIWCLNTNTGTWSTLTGTAPGGGTFTFTTPGHNLVTGTYYYTIGSSTAYPTVWYSYQTGVWSDWQNWTQDPSGTTVVNGLNITPQVGDEIVILNGITITNDVSGQIVGSTTIQGGATLDMSTTTGNTLGTVSGSGLLRINGVNLPTGTYTSFVTASTGGTIEYYNTGGTLPTTQLTYNNLTLSNSSNSNITFIQTNPSALSIKGDMSISQTSGTGTVAWQINDGTSNNRSITINGDLSVSASGKITAGTGNETSTTPHSLTIYGDLTNNGTISFFDNTDTEFDPSLLGTDALLKNALQGNAITVTFTGLTDQTLTCNGQTDFYRLVVNKGTGQQAMLTINSSSTANFRMFAPNNLNMSGSAPDYTSDNCLSIQNGTLQLTGSISIINLVVSSGVGISGGWPIPQNGALWVNGTNVTIQVTNTTDTGDNGRQMYVFGLLRLTNGTINMGYSRGLLGGGSGIFKIEGGTLNTRQLRTTYLGSNNRFAYTQTGGTVNVATTGIVGVDITSYPRFALPYPECSFTMSGGTINIAEPTVGGISDNCGLLINAATSNISVTGGRIKAIIPASTTNFGINTTAPLYNLYLSQAGTGTAVATLIPMTFNDGTSYTRTAQPLVISGDTLKLTNGTVSPTLNCNSIDLSVAGHFEIQTGCTLTNGTNTLTFNGTGAQTFTNNGTITSFNNVVVSKTAGTILTLAGGTFPSMPSLTLTSGTLYDNGKTVTVTTSLTNNATHTSGTGGSITYSNASASTISGSGGTFGNLTISNAAATSVSISTSGTQTVSGDLRLTNAFTSLNIGSNNLTVLGNIYSDASTATSFTSTQRILTSGSRNNGGLTRKATSGTDLLFPVGTGTSYTPATINVTATTAGNITVNPVTGQHPNATPTGQSVQYYWKIVSSGFSGVSTVTHKTYTFSSTGLLQGTLTSYKPFRYDPNNFTWTAGTTYTATSTTVIPNFSFGTNIDGEYTAGNLTAGAITVYYSKVDGGTWGTAATWSTLANRSNTAGSAPCATCAVVIGDGSTYNHTINVGANSTSCGSLEIASGSTLDCSIYTSLNFGVNSGEVVSGTGKLRINASSGQFPSGDFKNFLGTSGGTVEWYGSTTTAYTIPSTVSAYYNLIINPFAGQTLTMPAVDITVYNTLTKSGTGIVQTNSSASRNYTLKTVAISAGTFNVVTNGGNSVVSAFSLTGDLTVTSGASFAVSGGTVTHTLSTTGSITNGGTLDLRPSASTAVMNLTFTGTSNTSLSGTAPTSTRLNNITLNKGTSQTPVLTVDISATNLNALTTGWLTLSNGTINFNNSYAWTLSTSTTTAFSIPSTVKLKAQNGTVNVIGDVAADAGDLSLAGTLEVAGGAVNIDALTNNENYNNDIEYASAGSPTITVSSGSLYVNGAIRRSTSTLAGALVYNQTGGTVTVGGRNANTTRGVFEIESNTGSSFTLTGATTKLIISRPSGGSSYADLYINPATSSVGSTSTVYVGIAGTTQTIDVNVVPALGSFEIYDNTTANLESSELSTSGTLTIDASGKLLPNSLDVTIGGNLAINTTATYDGTVGGTNTTTFNGSGAQTASLSSTSTFLNITVNKSSGAVSLSGTSPTITNLNILSGTLDVGTLDLAVIGDITNNSAQTGTGTITISGTSSSHTITSSSGSFTNLSLGGTATTKKVTVTGNMTINGILNFTALGTNRYLFIGSYLLTFSTGASVSNSGSSRFIKTNGVSSDLGVLKNFAVATNNFTFAVGTRTNYTPITFTNLVVSTAGTLTVVPVDDQHPTASATGQQILNYYWIVQRNSTLAYGTTGTHAYQFPTTFVGGSGGTLIAAHLDAINLIGWTSSPGNGGSFSTAGSNTIMTFTNTLNTNLPAASGEFHYTAGTSNTLPSPITPVYSRFADANGVSNPTSVSNTSTGGNWNLATNWTLSSTGNGAALSVVPSGRPVVVLSGGRINLSTTGQKAFTTKIDGLLMVTTTGSNLGSISGTGTMRTTTNTLPAGTYTTFVSSAGGTIEYTAPMTMNSRSTYNNLSIIGTGTVTMTNTDLVLNGSVSIASGTILSNSSNNRDMTVAGSWTNNGTFTQGTGTVTFNGSPSTTITGSTTFNNLTLSKSGNNVTLSGTGPTTVNGTLTLTSGNLISITANKLTLPSAAVISGGSSSSYISGPISKVIATGGSFTFPLGSVSASRYRPATLANVSATDTWTAQYFGSDPSSGGYSHSSFASPTFTNVNTSEYWDFARTSASADLTLSFGSGSYSGGGFNSQTGIRVAHWNGSQWDLPSGSGTLSYTGDVSTGTVTITNVTSFSPQTTAYFDDTVLPVKWLSFSAVRENHTVDLRWKTAQEINNDHFEIERSIDGTTFNIVGTQAGSVNSRTVKSYQHIDAEVSDNVTYYYRIRQVDLDGKFDYSSVVAVMATGKSNNRWAAWPNPLNEQQQFHIELVDISIESTRIIEVNVISPNGSNVFTKSGTLSELNAQLQDLLKRVNSGIYLIHVSDKGYSENFRVARY
jgi:fibronectin-binding autotransporter adhesin